MSEVRVRQPGRDELEEMGVFAWPIWEKGPSSFPWSYGEREVCYLLEGYATITPDDGEPVTIQAGDLVTFPQGLACTWEIRELVRKHYRLGND